MPSQDICRFDSDRRVEIVGESVIGKTRAHGANGIVQPANRAPHSSSLR
jgi:hypothetical protein